ncbi:microtubule nucleation factor SSNA1-like [Ruditapes philippinarum]|uniref:microtubule nucleation factor SSNA1-like n=1 Tax=Ruditapes philippinarum TaxID=129788 RepID=UPI00295B1E52|nr:microtubule nucleation factor SSNA1-like [Ruditapes philippinarum]
MSGEPENKPRAQDATLQQYSLELLTCIDEMRFKRDTLHKHIQKEITEKDKLQSDLRRLTDRLVKVNETICDKVIARNRLDETIRETEAAFTNLAMGSESLLRFMKKVTASIQPEILSDTTTENTDTSKKKKQTKRTDASKR